ncbi:MAG: hypothetical protein J4F41_10215, partial [Alphaproteobacteria bacterium]|nr:hypothetical protein [Alphaproteobacteria bacterium]
MMASRFTKTLARAMVLMAVAMGPVMGAVMGAAHAQSTVPFQSGLAGLPTPLTDADVTRYQEIFALQQD